MEIQSNSDWLIEEFTSNQAKSAVILAATSLIQIAKDCCYPSLTLEELHDLIETVWCEMEASDEVVL